MKLFALLAFFAILVIFCDKFEEKLPPPVKWLYAGWKRFAHILGEIMSFIILTVLWVVGFGIYAVIMQIISLPKRFAADPKTYWIDVKPTTADSMKHQF